MEKARIFDVNEMEWKRDWPAGLMSAVMKITPDATLQYWEIPAGAVMAMHKHECSQLTYVQAGRMRFTINGEIFELGAGCFALIPPWAVHGAENIGSQTATNIDFFFPDRDDRVASEKIRDLGHKVGETEIADV